MNQKYKIKPSVLKSIFNRKGGEGEYTKLIDQYKLPNNLLNFIDLEELPIILFSQKSKLVLITDKKVIYSDSIDKICIINFNLIESVGLAFEEELKDKVTKLTDYSRIKIIDKNKGTHILQIEKGKPYNGIYQVLHFISSRVPSTTP